MGNDTREGIEADIERARALHDRASSDYAKCLQFNKLMGELLDRLEDAGLNKQADRVMGILVDCNPKEGSQCDKSQMVAEKIKKL